MSKLTLDQLKQHAQAHSQRMGQKNTPANVYRRTNKELVEIALTQIEPNPSQPRVLFDEAEIENLANSISTTGLIQPITVRPALETNKYHIVAGERRFRAVQNLGHTHVPCIIIKMNDEDNAIAALTENLSRQDLLDFEVATAIFAIKDKWSSKTDLAEFLGIARSSLYRFLSYENLPSVILDRLKAEPHLLTAKTSEQIVALVKDYSLKESDVVTILLDIFDLLKDESNRLYQSNIPELFEKKVSEFIATESNVADKPKAEINKQVFVKAIKQDGKKVGSLKKKGEKVVFEISQELWEEHFSNIEHELDALFAEDKL